MAKQIIKKRNVSICLGCVEEFSNLDLTIVTIQDKYGTKFQSVFCEKCVKEENYPEHESFVIVGPAAKPRKVRAKKEPVDKKTTKKTVIKKTTPKKKK